jgi:hypothetical protein
LRALRPLRLKLSVLRNLGLILWFKISVKPTPRYNHLVKNTIKIDLQQLKVLDKIKNPD